MKMANFPQNPINLGSVNLAKDQILNLPCGKYKCQCIYPYCVTTLNIQDTSHITLISNQSVINTVNKYIAQQNRYTDQYQSEAIITFTLDV